MRTRLKSTLAITAAAGFVATTFAITGGAPARSDESMGALTVVRPKVSRAHATDSRVAPPQSGVKLLEDIMQHMQRSSPQLAMAKNKQSRIYQQQIQQNAASAPQSQLTDQLLAIKPKEKYKPSDNRTLAYAPQQAYAGVGGVARGYANSEAFEESKAIASKKELDMDEARSKLPQVKDSRRARAEGAPVAEPQAGDYERTSQHANVTAGIESDKSRQRFDYAPNSYQNMGKAASNVPASVPQAAQSLSPEAQRRLGSSVGNLMNGLRQINELNQMANDAVANATANTRDAKTLRKGAYQQSQLKSAPMLIADRPQNITEYGRSMWAGADQGAQTQSIAQAPMGVGVHSALQGATNGSLAPPPIAESTSSANVLRPNQPGLYRTTREFNAGGGGGGAATGDAFSGTQNEQAARMKGISHVDKVALLPPNVITGIPIIRLGSSAIEANRTLSGMGSITKQQIGAWTVWSLNRAYTHETMLQIYMRHNIVEAMRIFDSSLIAQDFGVRLGDALPDVKRRFGEPAFILCEPSIPGGAPAQNYVYPISQVGFQLARPSNDGAPQVVSLLIFNVK